MRIQQHPALHLTYCLNIHPGETWAENLAAIREYAVAVKARVAPDRPFGLGLRVSDQASLSLADEGTRRAALDFFQSNRLYAYTINGFPFGRFHGGPVKESVYQPDWRTAERRDYTNRLADILALFLPEGVRGSISTVPCSFKPWIKSEADVFLMMERLLECVAHCDQLLKEQGREIGLALEPEPGCYLESTAETTAFFKALLRFAKDRRVGEEAVRRHLGVCIDTCHAAVQFEDLEEAVLHYVREGVRIPKIQLSAALETDTVETLNKFDEPVYLHQAAARQRDGRIVRWNDLAGALAGARGGDILRVHYHVPLFWEGEGGVRSTSSTLTAGFFDLVKKGVTDHLEIETYTFTVLPEGLSGRGIVESVTREYEWVEKALAR